MTDSNPIPLTPIDAALSRLLKSLPRIEGTESVAIPNATGRVLAEDIKAPVSVPGFTNSAMDGFAVRVADLAKVPTRLRVTQRIPAGKTGTTLNAGEAARIFTGAPLPPGADAVVMQENATIKSPPNTPSNANPNVTSDATPYATPNTPSAASSTTSDSIPNTTPDASLHNAEVIIHKAPQIGENSRPAGDDIQRGATLFKTGHRLRPQDAGVLASVGLTTVQVRRRPKVAIFTTGDELVTPGTGLETGQIYNSNLYSLTALLNTLQVEVIDLGVIADAFEPTRTALQEGAMAADCIISSGGVSVGEEDHVRAAVEAIGNLELWKLAIKPGKPFASGKVGGKQFFGLPGNPVSAFVSFVLLVRPLLLAMLGCEQARPLALPVMAGFAAPQSGERQEYLRVTVQTRSGKTVLVPFRTQSSGVNASLSAADGLAIIPPHTAVNKGDALMYLSFAELLGGATAKL